jgi:transposase
MEEVSVKNVENYPMRLFFQDEARFGRMSDPVSCWCPAPCRPIIQLALVREYEYINGAICPETGAIEYLRTPDMKTDSMSLFLRHVSNLHPSEFIIMVVDGASSHKSKTLVIPNNIELVLLPPYSPELNPVERLWHLLRRRYFANQYFNTLPEAMEQAERGLLELKMHPEAITSLSFWPWIRQLFNAN